MTTDTWNIFFRHIGWSINTNPETSLMYVGFTNHPSYGNLRARLEITSDIDNYHVLRGHAFARSAFGATEGHDEPLLVVGSGIMVRRNGCTDRSYGVIGFLVYTYEGSTYVDEFSATTYHNVFLPYFGSNEEHRIFTGWNWTGCAENIPNPPGWDCPLLCEVVWASMT